MTFCKVCDGSWEKKVARPAWRAGRDSQRFKMKNFNGRLARQPTKSDSLLFLIPTSGSLFEKAGRLLFLLLAFSRFFDHDHGVHAALMYYMPVSNFSYCSY